MNDRPVSLFQNDYSLALKRRGKKRSLTQQCNRARKDH